MGGHSARIRRRASDDLHLHGSSDLLPAEAWVNCRRCPVGTDGCPLLGDVHDCCSNADYPAAGRRQKARTTSEIRTGTLAAGHNLGALYAVDGCPPDSHQGTIGTHVLVYIQLCSLQQQHLGSSSRYSSSRCSSSRCSSSRCSSSRYSSSRCSSSRCSSSRYSSSTFLVICSGRLNTLYSVHRLPDLAATANI